MLRNIACIFICAVCALANGDVDLKGRGAQISWQEIQAEDGIYSGTLLGPTFKIENPAAEAVGRMAVKLEKTGDAVSWNAAEEGDGLSVRFCIPDAQNGGGINATLSLFVNGEKTESLNLTSKYAWIYGDENESPATWSNAPTNGTPKKFFDTFRIRLKSPVKKGDKIELRKTADDSAPFYIIDLIELEKIPPPEIKPDGYLNLCDFGAAPDDGKDDSAALEAALLQAFRKKYPGIWIPPGVFDFESPKPYPLELQSEYQRFRLRNVHLKGAGMWHTELRGEGIAFQCVGENIRVSDFAVDAMGTSRNSAVIFMGRVGKGAELWNLYAAHGSLFYSVMHNDARDLAIRNCRLRSLFAGGINLRGGHKNAVIENVHVRGSGDDGLILWSSESEEMEPNQNCTIRSCTVETPWVANGFLIAGGGDNRIENCVVKDTPRHCGVRVTTQIYKTPTQPFSGPTAIEDVTLIRCGAEKSGVFNGALQLEAHGHPVKQVSVKNCDLIMSPYSAIQLYNKIDEDGGGDLPVNAQILNCRIDSAGMHGIHIGPRTPGQTVISKVDFRNTKLAAVKNESPEMSIIQQRPNIVVIHTDDLDFSEISLFDERRLTWTPNIDRLFQNGIRFERAYVTSPVCVPSRYSTLTGRYASRCRDLENTVPSETPLNFENVWGKGPANALKTPPTIGPDEWTFGKLLRRAGYTTALFGKIHNDKTALERPIPDIVSGDPKDPETAKAIREKYEAAVARVKENYGFDFVGRLYYDNKEQLPIPDELKAINSPWITEGALEFLDSVDKTKPFLLYYSNPLPHGQMAKPVGNKNNLGKDLLGRHTEQNTIGEKQLATPSGYLEKSPDVQPPIDDVIKRFREHAPTAHPDGALLTWLDDSIGALLNKLDELKLAENTLILFVSDHQSVDKFTPFAQGAHVPMAACWPGVIKPGTVSESLVSSLDIAATLVDVSGASLPENNPIDGKSLSPLFSNPSAEIRDHVLIEFGFARGLITKEWQYIALRFPDGMEPPSKGNPMLHTGGERGAKAAEMQTDHPAAFDPDQLYHLTDDPAQRNNLWDNPEYKNIGQKLRQQLGGIIETFPHQFGEWNPK